METMPSAARFGSSLARIGLCDCEHWISLVEADTFRAQREASIDINCCANSKLVRRLKGANLELHGNECTFCARRRRRARAVCRICDGLGDGAGSTMAAESIRAHRQARQQWRRAAASSSAGSMQTGGSSSIRLTTTAVFGCRRRKNAKLAGGPMRVRASRRRVAQPFDQSSFARQFVYVWHIISQLNRRRASLAHSRTGCAPRAACARASSAAHLTRAIGSSPARTQTVCAMSLRPLRSGEIN